MCAVWVIECTSATSIVDKHISHVLRFVLRKANEAHPRAKEHFQLVLFLQYNNLPKQIILRIELCILHLTEKKQNHFIVEINLICYGGLKD